MLEWFQALPPTWQALVIIAALLSPKTGEVVVRRLFGFSISGAADIPRRLEKVEHELRRIKPLADACEREQERRQQQEQIEAVASIVAARLAGGGDGTG